MPADISILPTRKRPPRLAASVGASPQVHMCCSQLLNLLVIESGT
jgi:hypothetical protein